MSALHNAIAKGDLKTVQDLIEKSNYSPNDTGFTGLNPTPLTLAATYGHRHIMEYLIKHGADLNARGYWGFGESPFEAATSHYQLEATVCLLAHQVQLPAFVNKTELSNQLLFQAAKNNDGWAIDTLLQHTEADINLHEPTMQRTPLHVAVMNDSFDAVHKLITHNAKVNTVDIHGWSPLHYATTQGDLQVMQLLLKNGARVNSTDNDGRTPLYSAVVDGDSEAIKTLVDAGAKINMVDKKGLSPLDMAITNDDANTMNQLIQSGARITADTNKSTPLHFAAESGKLKAVDTLIDNSADMNAKNAAGKTPIELAFKAGHMSVVNSLILHGAEVPKELKDALPKPVVAEEVILAPNNTNPHKDGIVNENNQKHFISNHKEIHDVAQAHPIHHDKHALVPVQHHVDLY